MANRLPVFSSKRKVCIICEGNEEYEYIDRLMKLNVWNVIYEITLQTVDKVIVDSLFKI